MTPQTSDQRHVHRSSIRRSRRLSTALAVILASLLVSTSVASAAPITGTQVKLYASDAATEVGFGRAVAIDGDTALVSSAGLGPMTGSEGKPEVAIGSVYVFVREDGVWTEQAKITADDAIEGDGFGYAVAISGNIALISAPLDDREAENAGSAYLYERIGSTWSELARLTASDAAAGDAFGASVAVDGSTALVSAHGGDDDGAGSGSVYVFTRPTPDAITFGTPGDITWTEEAKLVAGDADGGDSFGSSVALSGELAIIGAPGNDDAGASSGSAYVFRRQNKAWSEVDKLTANDANAGARFGQSVAISGTTAVVGAPRGDVGAAYVFEPGIGSITTDPMGGGGAGWVQRARLTTPNADSSAEFGISVAVSGDTAAVGAWIGDAMSNIRGSVHVFSAAGNSWSEEATLTATEAPSAVGFGFSEWFGGSIAMSGETLAVGSGLDDDIEFNSGAAYIFSPHAKKLCKEEKTRTCGEFTPRTRR